jgi:hypothetical protein
MRFSLHLRSTRKLTLNEAPIVTIVGKAFWDIGHAPKDQSNRRKYMPGYAVWEIHPVMKIDVQSGMGNYRRQSQQSRMELGYVSAVNRMNRRA